MKILHCCLSNFYIDGFNYQENMLVREHVSAGHEVLVLASTETFDSGGCLSYLDPGRYFGADGAEVIRLPYRQLGPHFLRRKIRAYPDVYKVISEFCPDVILFHGAAAWELMTVIRYKENNPKVKFYIDSHEDFNNSARNFFSKNILHRLFYRPVFEKSLPHVEKVLCVSMAVMDFMHGFYRCPEEKLRYFPLGGIIFDDGTYRLRRMNAREKHGISAKTLVFIQSGKFDKKKRLVDSLNAFKEVGQSDSVVFLVAGVLQDDVKIEVEQQLSKDGRVRFLGWQSGHELMDLLCAADVYVQPGSQSATLQNSICCRCAVIADDVPSHHPFVNSNGWLVRDIKQLKQAFEDAMKASADGRLERMSKQSVGIASQLLDYKIMAKSLVE